jgi:transcription-repair coupling factor (superfamily II helicase)
MDEMVFAPDLRCALFDRTLPLTPFRRTRMISERWPARIQQHDKQTGSRGVVPATTALYRLAPPAF